MYESSDVAEQSSRYLTIEKAKNLVGRIAPAVTKAPPTADSALLPADYTTIWEQAREETQGVLEAVEIPMASSRELFAIDKQGRESRVEQRILVADGEKFSWTEGYVMTIIPDADYGGELWDMQHAGDKRNFSGVILYHSLISGQFVRIDHYKTGKSIKHIYVPTYKGVNLEILDDEVDEILDATKLYYEEHYTKGNRFGIPIRDVVIWGNRPHSGSGSGGIIVGGGSGNGGGDTGDQFLNMTIHCPQEGGGGIGFTGINTVFRNNGLSDLHARQINAALASLQSRCMSKGLVNMMANSNITIRYGTMTDPKVLAQFEGVSTGSYLNVNPEAFNSSGDDLQNAILHELFHAYHFINYYGNGTNIGYQTYKLASEFMAYTFVNLHYGYSMKGTDHVIPPTDGRPWMKDYLNDISTATNQYRNKITQSQLNTLFNRYKDDYSKYIGHTPSSADKTDLYPLVNLLKTVLNNNDCIYLE